MFYERMRAFLFSVCIIESLFWYRQICPSACMSVCPHPLHFWDRFGADRCFSSLQIRHVYVGTRVPMIDVLVRYRYFTPHTILEDITPLL